MHNNIDIQYFKTAVGELILGSYNDQLCLLDYRNRKMREQVDKRLQNALKADYRENNNSILDDAKLQINDYLCAKRQQFDLPLLMVGTNFQKQVWQALLTIPYGETCSYLQLAKNINNEKAVRAVASANGANAISLIIPCHRIIGSNGDLVGYAGGLPAKQYLLNLENPK